MLKAFLLLYCFTSFSTPRFRVPAMCIFASVQANLIDSTSTWARGVVQQKEPQAIRQDTRILLLPLGTVWTLVSSSLCSVCSWANWRQAHLSYYSPKWRWTAVIQFKVSWKLCLVIAMGVGLPDLTWEPVASRLPRTLNSFQICRAGYLECSFFLPAFLS